MTVKACARCKEVKAIADFPPGKKWSDGLFPYCRECKRAVQRADHARHREARNAVMRAAYKANPEPYKQRAAAAYKADPDHVKANVTAWQGANRDKVREYQSRDSKAHPERTREAWRRRNARKQALTVMPITTQQIAAKVAYWGSKCWICRGEYEAMDHVKPLAKGGGHVLANLRPVCRSCNTRKRDRWPFAVAA